MSWQQVTDLGALGKGPVVFRAGPRQLVVLHVNGEVFAIDNRCPHEGYPLAQGTVDDQCQLTCNWHNWKFRLTDGKCVLGGDHVRSYQTRVEGDEVWVHVADPPAEELREEVMQGLREAFTKREFDRICRELSRLYYHQLRPEEAIIEAIGWSHDRLEYGFTHAFAVTADWLELAEQSEDWEDRLICLAEAIDHMAHDSLRHPRYAFVQDPQPFDSDKLLSAIEAEQLELAEAMVQGALSEGVAWAELHRCFCQAALAHYNSFGHSLIYCLKADQLVGRLGHRVVKPLALALVRHLCYATREDLIPEFKDYGPALARCSDPASDAAQEASLLAFPATLIEALDWVVDRCADTAAEVIYESLLGSLARTMIHYDTTYQHAIDRPVQDNVSWLQFTHSLTFSNAVRHAALQDPSLWRPGLLQMALFLGRSHGYLDLDQDVSEWHVEDATSFLSSAYQGILDHGQRDPIFSSHLLKTTMAVDDELRSASASAGGYLLSALNRFLHSPLKQKHVRRLARQANELVARDFRETP